MIEATDKRHSQPAYQRERPSRQAIRRRSQCGFASGFSFGRYAVVRFDVLMLWGLHLQGVFVIRSYC
jgi:hypothetical protein